MTSQTLLIVDDSTDNLKLLGNSLKNAGYNILTALTGKQALGLAASKLPDLILLDVMMPEMNGFEVCEALKENSLTFKIPVIFLTALVETESIKTGFEAGAIDYIAKPFNPDELILRIKNHLNQQKQKHNLEQELKYKSTLLKSISDGMLGPVSDLLKNSSQASSVTSEGIKAQFEQIHFSASHILKYANNLADLSEMENAYRTKNENFGLRHLLQSLGSDTELPQIDNPELKIIIRNELDEVYFGDKFKFRQALLQIIRILKHSHKTLISINAFLKEREKHNDLVTIEFYGLEESQGTSAEREEYFSDREVGLVIAKELLRYIDGRIIHSQTSALNSAFSIEVSLQRLVSTPQNENKFRTKNQGRDKLLSGQNILIVEDNVLNQRLIESVLQSYGAGITIAQNGKEALEKGSQNNYQLILMDVNVPLMNGIKVTSLLRNNHNISVPIIAISGHSDKKLIKECMDAGMNAFILKPFEIGDLVNNVLRELDKYQGLNRSYLELADNSSNSEKVEKYSLEKIHQLANGDEKLVTNWTGHFRTLVKNGKAVIAQIIDSGKYESENKIFHELNNYTSYFGVELLREYLKDLPEISRSGTNEELMGHFQLIKEELECIDAYFNETEQNAANA